MPRAWYPESVHTENRIIMDAPAARIYELAAHIERWPRILPHYRYVTLLRDEGDWRLAEMAATRDGVPVKWVSIQELSPDTHGIRFRHVRGVTRGMDVAWIIEPHAEGGMLVRIVHDFDPPWPRPLGPLVARYIVGAIFVHNIANRTLRRIKQLVEDEQVGSRKSEVESKADM